jgi:hypothetical protein
MNLWNGKKLLTGTCLGVALAMAFVPVSAAEETGDGLRTGFLGWHVGVVVPLVSRSNGETTTVADNFTFGSPFGVTVLQAKRMAVDLELVPSMDPGASNGNLTFHPGLIVGLKDKLAAGVRAAVDVKGSAWGFTPLINRAFSYGDGDNKYFFELVLPVRFVDDDTGESHTSVGMGVHFGFAF